MVGRATGGIDACVDGLNGNKIQNVHTKCIPEPQEVVCDGGRDPNCKPDPTGFKMTGEYIGAGFNYMSSLIVGDTNSACSEKCTFKSPYKSLNEYDENPNCIPDTTICSGQRYVTPFGKCIDNATGKEEVRYIYKGIDKLTGGSIKKTIIATARPFTENRFGEVMANDPTPKCTAVRLRCAVLDSNDTAIGGKPGDSRIGLNEMYGGHNTGLVHIADHELDRLARNDLIIDDSGNILEFNSDKILVPKPNYGEKVFKMLDSATNNGKCSERGRNKESFENILNDINNLNLDNLDNIDNIDNLLNNNNFSTSMSEELYFILLSIFLCYIIYKIIYKK